MTNDFAATRLSTELVSTTASTRTRSELHGMAFLMRYRNQRTRDGYQTTLTQFFRWCAEVGVEPLDATRNHIELFMRDLEYHGRGQATIATKMTALAGFYKYAVIDRLIDDNPMAAVERPNVPRESTNLGLTRPELANIMIVAKDYGPSDHAIIAILAYNGVRVSELTGLNVPDYQRIQGRPTIRILRKGGKYQTIPLDWKPAWQIEQTIGDRREGPLFINRDGHRIDRRYVSRLVKRTAIAARITKRVTPHSFRHGFVTISLEAGRSERDIAASVGHADTRLIPYYDRARDKLERNTTYSVASLIEGSM